METYTQLLESKEWKSKRKNIINRDKHICQNCKNETYIKLEGGLANFTNADLYKNKISPVLITQFENDKKQYNQCYASYKQPYGGISNKIVYFAPAWKGLKFIIAIREPGFDIKINPDYFKNGVCCDSDSDSKLESIFTDETIKKLQEKIDLNNCIWNYVQGLHVHHKYYQKNKKPWEYDNSALITLCWECHERLHANNTQPAYDDQLNYIGEYHFCPKCHGAGWFPQYKHIEEGICFRCRGAQYVELIK